MPDIKLAILLILCIIAAVIFLLPVILGKDDVQSEKKYIVIPIDADTENIELITREIVLKAIEYYDNAGIILLDMGATEEQLIIFDKIVGDAAEYKIISAKKTQ